MGFTYAGNLRLAFGFGLGEHENVEKVVPHHGSSFVSTWLAYNPCKKMLVFRDLPAAGTAK